MESFLIIGTLTALSFFCGLYLAKRRSAVSNSYIDLLVGTTVLSPLMVGGFTWYEEFFLGGYIVAKYFSQVKVSRNPPKIKFGVTHILLLYFFLELALGFYLFYQNGEIAFRKIRWVLFLILIYGVISESKKNQKQNNSLEKIHLKVMLSFALVYFFWNQITIWKTGSAAYAQYAQVPARGTREAIWANTAYVTPSILICIAFAMICALHSAHKSMRIYSMLIIIFCVLGQAVALSRSGILIIFLIVGGSFIGAVSRKRTSRFLSIAFLVSFSTIIGLLLAGPGMLSGFLFDIRTTITIPLTNIETNRESDRLLQFTDAYRVIREGTPTEALIRTLFGYGLRTSGLVLQKTEITLSRDSHGMSLVPNLLIETGVVGVLLFMIFFLIGLSITYRNNSGYKLFESTVAFGLVSTTLIVNNFDMAPLYIFFIYGQGFISVSKLAKEQIQGTNKQMQST